VGYFDEIREDRHQNNGFRRLVRRSGFRAHIHYVTKNDVEANKGGEEPPAEELKSNRLKKKSSNTIQHNQNRRSAHRNPARGNKRNGPSPSWGTILTHTEGRRFLKKSKNLTRTRIPKAQAPQRVNRPRRERPNESDG